MPDSRADPSESYFGPSRGPADIERIYELRRVVFCGEQRVSEAEEFDGRDDEATQIVGEVGGEVIGTCRLLFDGSSCRLGRMAVSASARGGGHGAQLIEAAEVVAAAEGAAEIVLHAQRQAEGFYAAAGFRPEGGTFVEADIPHVLMRKRLSAGVSG